MRLHYRFLVLERVTEIFVQYPHFIYINICYLSVHTSDKALHVGMLQNELSLIKYNKFRVLHVQG